MNPEVEESGSGVGASGPPGGQPGTGRALFLASAPPLQPAPPGGCGEDGLLFKLSSPACRALLRRTVETGHWGKWKETQTHQRQAPTLWPRSPPGPVLLAPGTMSVPPASVALPWVLWGQ